MTAWYLGVLVTALVLFSAGVWLALRQHLTQSMEITLAERTDGLVQFLRLESLGSDLAAIQEETREYTSGLPVRDTLRLYGADGTLLFASPALASQRLYVRREQVTVMGNGLTIELGTPLDDVDEELASLRNILLSSIPFVVLFAGFGGWWISRKALKPVDQMTIAAESISAADLSARLEVPASNDELERLGRAWNRMLGRIELSVQQMKQLTADAAHELRTPVAVIRTASELALRREREPAAYRVALDGILEESQRMSDLVDALLWLARNDAFRMDDTFDQVPVVDAVSNVHRVAGTLAESKGVRMVLDAQVSPETTVHADPSALRRLILTLADNAIKFSPAGGTVNIRVRVRDALCRIEVEDRGPGIAVEDLPRIFDRFYRGDRARSTPGAGLGLAIAAAIASRHGGEIRARNVAAGGACFEVDLPLGQRAASNSGPVQQLSPSA
jgi:heavy metal sensor kinase